MTPIHHTFEKIGWKEEDIVKVFLDNRFNWFYDCT